MQLLSCSCTCTIWMNHNVLLWHTDQFFVLGVDLFMLLINLDTWVKDWKDKHDELKIIVMIESTCRLHKAWHSSISPVWLWQPVKKWMTFILYLGLLCGKHCFKLIQYKLQYSLNEFSSIKVRTGIWKIGSPRKHSSSS